MDREGLISIFDTAKLTKMDIAVEVTVPGQETTEVIVNRFENLDNKLAFYTKAYDENCVHCMNKEVKIVNAWCIKFFEYYDKQKGEMFTSESNVMNFGEAIKALKEGKRVSRLGWNGKDQYIELAHSIAYINAKGETINEGHTDIGNKVLAFVGTRGVQLGWLASQADMLAEDWVIKEEE